MRFITARGPRASRRFGARAAALLGAALGGCGADLDSGGKGGADGGGGGARRWFTTCGDPECGGYSGPTEGLPLCTDEAEGAACPALGQECDLQDDCNTRMICATADPKDQEVGCPMSLAAVKREISYLDGPARAAAARQALELRLATWRYTDPARGEGLKLGILLDDLGPPGAAHPAARGDRVDLYGLSSLTVAAVQEQAAALEAERAARLAAEARLAALEARLSALEARGCP